MIENESIELARIHEWENPIALDARLRTAIRRTLGSDDRTTMQIGYYDEEGLPPFPNVLSEFGSWSSVIATIYNKTRELAHFNPAVTTADDDWLELFKRQFASNPYWNGIEFSIAERIVEISNFDLKPAVNAVQDLFEVIVAPNLLTSLTLALRKLSELAVTNRNKQQKQTTFDFSSITAKDGRVYAVWSYSYLSFKLVSDRKYNKLQQLIHIVRAYGALDYNFCGRHADSIKQYDKKNLVEWEGQGSAHDSPLNDNPSWP